MPLVSTDYQVSLGRSVSSAELQVAYVAGPTNTVLAFQKAPVALTNIRVDLTASGCSFSIDRAYNNTLFAIISADRQSTIFRVITGTAVQGLTGNGTDTVTQEFRRLYSLGYL